MKHAKIKIKIGLVCICPKKLFQPYIYLNHLITVKPKSEKKNATLSNISQLLNIIMIAPNNLKLKGAYWISSNSNFFYCSPLLIALPTLR